MDLNKKLNIIIRAICVFWFIARIRANKVWLPEYRVYPSIPIFDFLDGYPLIIQTSLYLISLVTLITIFIYPKKRIPQIILIISVILSSILDTITWQPWEYQYLCILIAIVINRRNPHMIFSIILIILASIYFYSGLQKFNGAFLHSVWKGLILKKFFSIDNINLLTHYSGLIIAIIESILGLGLIFSKTRMISAYLLIAMHLFILVLLGSIQGFNIVLPWNILMIVIIHNLFINKPANFDYLSLKNFNFIFVILWCIMPAFSFFGLWDQKLSSNLFSGKFENLTICINGDIHPDLKDYVIPDTKQACNSQTRISITKWTTSEMFILPPSGKWYYCKVIRKLSNKYSIQEDCFYINTYPFKALKPIKN